MANARFNVAAKTRTAPKVSKMPKKSPKKNPAGRTKAKTNGKNPFGNLGSRMSTPLGKPPRGSESQQPVRFGVLKNQGKKMTGSTLLKHAMGKIARSQ